MSDGANQTLERQLRIWADDLVEQSYGFGTASDTAGRMWLIPSTASRDEATPTEVRLHPQRATRPSRRRYASVAAAAALLAVVGLGARNLPGRSSSNAPLSPTSSGSMTGPPPCEGVTGTTTKGTMPANAVDVPDFIGVAGPEGIVGYARWDLLDPLQNLPPQPADGLPFPSGTTFEVDPVPVCDESLTSVVGHIYVQRGFVPLGTDPESVPKLCSTTVSGNGDGTEERRTTY